MKIESVMDVCDNSGIVKVKIIGLYNYSVATINNFVLTCLKKTRAGKEHQAKHLALIVGVRRWQKRRSGNYLKFDRNSCLLLKDASTLLGSKFSGPIAVESQKFLLSKNAFFKKNFV